MKKFILAVLTLTVLAIAGASVYVSTIDWNKHKGKISTQLQEITGKRIVFNGPVSMTVFPSPSLNASNVRIYSAVNQDLEHPLMKIDTLTAKLSLSALLSGDIDVKMMSLEKPHIYIHKNDKEINWADDAQTNMDAELKGINISLDSVLLRDAVVNIIDDDNDINTTLNNLNAEIVADSLNGPYRIDGSYVKGNNPEGFAISVGSLSDSFATNLNFVLSQPSSETYLRFDGTFLLSNEAVNGNLILESQNFKQFYDSLIPSSPLPTYWDKRLEASMELKVNQTLAELSNVILKYGDTAGAGSISVPLKGKSYVIGESGSLDLPEVSVKLDMTNWDLEPFVAAAKDFVNSQLTENAVYSPEIPFDLKMNITALKAMYNDQSIKDFALKVNLHNDVWQLEGVDGIFPGNSQLKATGRMFSVEDILSYTLSVDAKTDSLKKLLEWLGVSVTPVANSTYQKASLQAAVVGDARAVQIVPFTLAVDNSVVTGNFGVKRGKVPYYALEAATDSIILDNYMPKLFEGEMPADEMLRNLWSKSQWANTVDFDVSLKAGLLIYDRTSFDKTEFKASLQKGILNIETLTIGDFLKSHLALSGEVSGFGGRMQLSNLNYAFNGADFVPWLQKLKMEQPVWNIKYFQPFSSQGVISKNVDRLWLKTDSKAGPAAMSYNGSIEIDKGYSLNGEVQLKTPNASELLKNLPINYIAQDDNLGQLSLKGQIAGNDVKFKLTDMTLSTGGNTFQGAAGADLGRQVPYFAANLKINRFEPERFFPKGKAAPRFNVEKASSRSNSAWAKPNLDDLPFNRDVLKKLHFATTLDIGELVLKDKLFKNVKARFDNQNNELVLADAQGGYYNGAVAANLRYQYLDKPMLTGEFSVTNQNIHDMNLMGSVYGLKSGTAEIHVAMNTSAVSPRDILNNFTGTLKFNIDSPLVAGIDLNSIADDIAQRKQSDGLQNILRENLQRGETLFNKFSGKVSFKNGSWQVDRAWLKSDTATVDVSGNGNLEGWRMDEVFSVQLTEPSEVQPFRFGFKGAIASPELEVDASAITKVYDDRKAQIEAVERAKQKAYEENLQNKLDVQKAVLHEAQEFFDDFINNNYLPIKNKITGDDNKVYLENIEDKFEAQVQAFADAETLLQEKTVKEDTIVKLAEISEKAKKLLEEAHADMLDVYMKDMREQIASNYNAIQEETAGKDRDLKESLSKRDIYMQRLGQIQTDYRFQSDKLYGQLLDTIDESLQLYDEGLKNLRQFKDVGEGEAELDVLEQMVKDSSNMLAKAQKQRERVSDNIHRYLTYLDEKIKIEEKAFADRKEAEAKAKKIEENIGKITTTGTGKVQTIIRGIDDIEESENKVPSPDDVSQVKDLEINLLPRNEIPSNVSGVIKKK